MKLEKAVSYFRKNIQIGVLVGFIAGCLFGVLDAWSAFAQAGKPIGARYSVEEIIRIAGESVLFYVLFTTAMMFIVGSLFAWLFKINRLELPSRKLAAFYSTILTVLAASVALVSQTEKYAGYFPGGRSQWTLLVVLLSLIAGGHVYLILDYLLSRIRFKMPSLRIFLVGFTDLVLFFAILFSFTGNLPKDQYSTKPAQMKNSPNILWIVVDTLRADHLSCYGYPLKTTPFLDELAKESALYENCISPSSWTPPSHASMFTGQYLSKHGVELTQVNPNKRVDHRLDNETLTISKLTRRLGYFTLFHCNNPYVRAFNLESGFLMARYSLDNLYLRALLDEILMTGDRGAAFTNPLIKRWIDKCKKKDTPFFIFINYIEMHVPSGGTPLRNKFYPRPITRKERGRLRSLVPIQTLHSMTPIETSPKDRKIAAALYDGDLLYMDQRIKELVEYLKKSGLLDDTILIITSDHGEQLGEHGLWGHIDGLYEPLLRVPLIIRYPKLFKPGSRIKDLVQLTDIYPTLADILKVEKDRQIQGKSLLDPKADRTFAISERFLSSRMRAIHCSDGFKLFDDETTGKTALYDLKEDPGELHDLIKTNPQEALRLKEALRAWLGSFEHHRDYKNF